MRYIAWAILIEGKADQEYLTALIPRLINNIIFESREELVEIPDQATIAFSRSGSGLESSAIEICNAKEAFQLLFVHGDSGGRSMTKSSYDRVDKLCDLINSRCDFEREYCICVKPVHETEAWSLADQDALRSAFGCRSNFPFPELPNSVGEVEGILDPKSVSDSILRRVRRNRRNSFFPFTAIAQFQDFSVLRRMKSFQDFEDCLRVALRSIGFRNIT